MIRFFIEDINYFSIKKKNCIKKYLKTLLKDHNFKVGNINYIFCSDNYLIHINRQFLNHDYYTDIITFNNSIDNKTLDADLFISIDRVLENSKKLNECIESEIIRVLVHGLLHLVGYNDKSLSEEKIIRQKENEYIQKFIDRDYFDLK